MSDQIILVVFPYVAVALAVVVSIVRYRTDKFKFSSLSSQFLEGNHLFWGSALWHYGILFVLAGHLVGFFFPKELLMFNSVPIRLFILETTGLAMALMAFVGLLMLIYRRFTNQRIRVVTTNTDYVVLLVLLVQVISGIAIAISLKWGSNWYATNMVPYLRSLLAFSPNLDYVATMPAIVKLHIVNAFVFIAIIPFTRFVHFLVVPLQYVFRPWQLVRWNWDPKKSRTSKGE